MQKEIINKTFSSNKEREDWLKAYDAKCRSEGKYILLVQNKAQQVGVPEEYTIESVTFC